MVSREDKIAELRGIMDNTSDPITEDEYNYVLNNKGVLGRSEFFLFRDKYIAQSQRANQSVLPEEALGAEVLVPQELNTSVAPVSAYANPSQAIYGQQSTYGPPLEQPIFNGNQESSLSNNDPVSADKGFRIDQYYKDNKLGNPITTEALIDPPNKPAVGSSLGQVSVNDSLNPSSDDANMVTYLNYLGGDSKYSDKNGGRYRFSKATAQPYLKALGKTWADFGSDSAVQDSVATSYTADSLELLESKGLSLSRDNAELLHRKGRTGGLRAIRSQDTSFTQQVQPQRTPATLKLRNKYADTDNQVLSLF